MTIGDLQRIFKRRLYGATSSLTHACFTVKRLHFSREIVHKMPPSCEVILTQISETVWQNS